MSVNSRKAITDYLDNNPRSVFFDIAENVRKRYSENTPRHKAYQRVREAIAALHKEGKIRSNVTSYGLAYSMIKIERSTPLQAAIRLDNAMRKWNASL